MAEQADYDLLREDVGVSATKLDDTKAAAIFAEAEAKYASNEDAIFAYARVRAFEKLWAQSAEEDIDYTQNEESEDLGERAINREKLLAYWQEKLAEAVAAARVPEGARPFAFALGKATARRWYP